jgi:predicted nucleotidyltransferase component of viral defense system
MRAENPMSVDARLLARVSSETGFRSETLEKVVRLGELLHDVSRHPLLRRVLALKGGTAINLCYGEPRRLSVDLDFNYVGQKDRKAMLEDRPEVERALRGVATGRGYGIQESAEEHGGRKLFLGYRNTSGNLDRIEIDVNYLYRIPLVPLGPLAIWQPSNLDRPSAQVVGFEELAAGKLVACLDRVAPRDLFDVSFLPQLDPGSFQSPRFRRVFLAMAATLPHPVYTYAQSRLSRVTARRIQTELGPMLAGSASLDPETLGRDAWDVLKPLVELLPHERAFVDGISRGENDVAGLVPDDQDLVAAVRDHPAILWKIKNVREHLPK